MTKEKKIFGRTPQDIRKIAQSVSNTIDRNHPKKRKSEGGDFISAMREGEQLLQSNESFVRVLQTIRRLED